MGAATPEEQEFYAPGSMKFPRPWIQELPTPLCTGSSHAPGSMKFPRPWIQEVRAPLDPRASRRTCVTRDPDESRRARAGEPVHKVRARAAVITGVRRTVVHIYKQREPHPLGNQAGEAGVEREGAGQQGRESLPRERMETTW